MERRDRILLGTGVGAAALAAALALLLSGGSVDDPHPPPDAAPPGGSGGGGSPAARRALPPLPPAALEGLPAEAAEGVRRAWTALSSGTDGEGREALRALESPDPGTPLSESAPACLRALAPALTAVVAAPDDPLAGPAMAAAAGLARAGGAGGREALRSTGFVERALALQAGTGLPALRVQAARLLGLVGGKEAVEWLVILARQAVEEEVRTAAVLGIAEAFRVERPPDSRPMIEVVRILADPAAPAAVRRACLDTASRAWTWFQPYGVEGPAAAALRDPDTLLAAARFFDAHPLTGAGPALLEAAGSTSDPRILEHLAAALGEIRPPGARALLEGILPGLEDPAARKAVESALRRIGVD